MPSYPNVQSFADKVEFPEVTASDVYAKSQGQANKGELECHWCASRCDRRWNHDEVAYIPFAKNDGKPRTYAKKPANLNICCGCWLFRRKSLTVMTLDGKWKDRQCPGRWGWWITEKDAWGIEPGDEKMYDLLLHPPLRFVLALREGEHESRLQFMLVNENPGGVLANTQLQFTLNDVVHVYTVYELEDALTSGEVGGKEPGVRKLVEYFGALPIVEKERKAGHPDETAAIMKSRRVVRDGAEVKKDLVKK